MPITTIRVAVATTLGFILLACGGTTSQDGSTSSNAAASSKEIATCDSGLDVSGSDDFVECSLSDNVCALPQELCRLSDGEPVGAGHCVCDPRRVDNPDPGNPSCKDTGNTCVSSESKCQDHGGNVNGDVGCSGSDVCCENYITSPNDPGCTGANVQDGSCVDSDDNSLPSICCSGS
jgi:hypothetical protein